MISSQAEQVRNQIKQVVGPMLKASINVPIETRRIQYEALMSRTELPPDVEIETVEAGGVPCEWVSISAGASHWSQQVIMYLHGGAYTVGSARSDRMLTSALARVTEQRVLSVDYRLAPEHPFPAALEDALTAYRWLLTTGREPEHLIVAGISAGGGLALATLVALRDTGTPLPAGAVLLSAGTDFAASGPSHSTNIELDLLITPAIISEARTCYLGERDPRTPLASPFYADLHGLPPLLIHVGSDEVVLDDSTQVAERARAAGVNVTLHIGEWMLHGWHMSAARKPFPEGQAALEQIGDFARKPGGN